MDDDITEKIKRYCEKVNMRMNKFSIKIVESGYVATDEYTSIMFDKEGKVSSLPMHSVYGRKTTQLMGKGYAICMCIAVIAIVIAMIIGNVIKSF